MPQSKFEQDQRTNSALVNYSDDSPSSEIQDPVIYSKAQSLDSQRLTSEEDDEDDFFDDEMIQSSLRHS